MSPLEVLYHRLNANKFPFGEKLSDIIPCGDGGKKAHFENVSFYLAPHSSDAFSVSGFLLEKYKELGEEKSFLGYPTQEVEKQKAPRYAQSQLFQNGWMRYTPKKGVEYGMNATNERGIGELFNALAKYPKEAQFFRQYYNAALILERELTIPALFTLAQSALETGWGKKAPANNMFGVKADKTWTGKKVLVETDEYFKTGDIPFPDILSVEYIPALNLYKYRVRDWFRAYDTPLDSFMDRAAFLLRKRYARAFLYQDPYNFAREIAAAGYATNPNYYALLANIITRLEAIRIALQNQMIDYGGSDVGNFA